MKVLIIGDADARGTVAAVRGLGRAGWKVGVGSPRRGHATASRYCAAWHPVSFPGRSIEDFVGAINRAAATAGYELVFGGGDAEVLALSAARSYLHLNVPYADDDAICRAVDKWRLYEAAERAGIRTPRTVIATEQAIAQVAGKVVVKPRLHWSPSRWTAASRLEAAVVSTPDDARRHVRRINDGGGTALLQDFVEGNLMAYVALTSKTGLVIDGFVQASEGTWPPERGLFTRAVTTEVSTGLAEQVERLLADLRWFGITQVQFIQPSNGDPYLIDFNGRYYVSLSLPVEAGLNLPAMWACLATEREVSTRCDSLPAGVRYQWLELDLRRAFVERKGGAIRDLVDTLSASRGAIHTMWRRDDLAPGIDYLIRSCVRVVHRRSDSSSAISLPDTAVKEY
jgi:predicted ATP-grasp superfamily ATP-dependent carboligase